LDVDHPGQCTHQFCIGASTGPDIQESAVEVFTRENELLVQERVDLAVTADS